MVASIKSSASEDGREGGHLGGKSKNLLPFTGCGEFLTEGH